METPSSVEIAAQAPSLFAFDRRGRATPAINPDAVAVATGRGQPTRLWEGIPARISGGQPYRPWLGQWAPVESWDGAFMVAIKRLRIHQGMQPVLDGGYTLVGPGVGANGDGFDDYYLMRDGNQVALSAPRGYDELPDWLVAYGWYGIVWREKSEPLAIVTRSHFGLPWPPED